MDKCRSYIAKMKEDDRYKAEIFLCLGFCLNMLYCIWNVVCGIFVHSPWLWTMAFYYMLLSTMRVNIFRTSRKADEKECWRQFIKCGILLSFSSVALIGMSILLQLGKKTIRYPGYLIYGIAFYTFAAITMSIIHVNKYRKKQEPFILAGKIINLAKMIVSLFMLEAAMTAMFGSDPKFYRVMGISVGMGAFILIEFMAFWMIRKGMKEVKKYESSAL